MKRVISNTSVQYIISCVAGDGIGQCVAGAVDVAGVGEGQVLDEVAQGVADAGLDGVGASGINRARGRGGLIDLVADVVDDIGVVARTAQHDVSTRATINQIITGSPLDFVIPR